MAEDADFSRNYQDYAQDDGNDRSNEPSDDSPCNLIVKYLPDSVSEDVLREMFSPHGSIVKCRVIMDKNTGRSRGYGFVKFDNEESARRATEAMQGHRVGSKSLRVSAANTAPKSKSNHSGNSNQNSQPPNVYVAGLPHTYTKQDLHNLFSPYGDISEAKLLIDKSSGQHRGVGFVHFANHENAVDAIRSLHGTTLDSASQPLNVKFARSTPSGNQMGRASPYGALNMQQQQMGSGYGPIRGHMPFYPQNTGMQSFDMGYGYFPQYGNYPQDPSGYDSYEQPNFGSYGFGNMNMNMMNRNQQNFGNQGSQGPDAGLFVFHIPPSCNEERLRELFSQYGQVAQVKIISDPQSGASKGYGFVNMGSMDQANAAIAGMNGYSMDGKYLKVSFKKKNK